MLRSKIRIYFLLSSLVVVVCFLIDWIAIAQAPAWTFKYIVSFILGNICVLFTIGWMLFIYFTAKRLSILNEKKIQKFAKISTLILGIVLFIVPLFLIVQVPDSPSNWDFFEIFKTTSYLHGRSFGLLPVDKIYTPYYLRYPNNQFWGILNNSLFASLTTNTKIWVETFLSALMTSFSVVCGSHIVKEISNLKVMIVYNLIAFGFLPFYFFGAIFYTDTSSMPFAMGGLLLILKAMSLPKRGLQCLFWFLASTVIALGYALKPTVLIVLLAALLFLLIKRQWKKLLIALPIVVVMLFSINTGVKMVIAQEPAFSQQANNHYNLPMMHWVAMSFDPTNENGIFDTHDLLFSQSFPDLESKNKADTKFLLSSLKRMGFLGTIAQLGRKAANVWLSGGLSDLSLTSNHVNPLIHNYFDRNNIHPDKGNVTGSFLLYSAQTIYWLGIIFFSFYEIILSIFRKFKGEVAILSLTVIGFAVFLLIWEANPRYIYIITPVIIALSALGVVNLLTRKSIL